MKVQKNGLFKSAFLSYLFPFITFALILCAVCLSVFSVGETSREQGKKICEDAIRRAILSCYAQEGSYPPSIEYLEENYELRIDQRYTVHYTVIGSNLPPDLTVLEKQELV